MISNLVLSNLFNQFDIGAEKSYVFDRGEVLSRRETALRWRETRSRGPSWWLVWWTGYNRIEDVSSKVKRHFAPHVLSCHQPPQIWQISRQIKKKKTKANKVWIWKFQPNLQKKIVLKFFHERRP